MKTNERNNPSFTVGIATCYGGDNLVATAKSIRESINAGNFSFIVVADTIPITKGNLKKLKNLKVEVCQNKNRSSQAAKFKQIIDKTKTDLLFFTQDDVGSDPFALSNLIKVFNDPDVTMSVTRVKPFPASSVLEKILEVGVNGVYRIGELFNKGDNYLLVNGRCMAFRSEHLMKMNILENVANLDAYLYFENKRLGGKFKFAEKSILFNKSPIVMSEHMHQSSRFQYSRGEMQKYFDNLDREYRIPKYTYLIALLKELLTNPFYTVLYSVLFIYTRIKPQEKKKAVNAMWTADVSTKR